MKLPIGKLDSEILQKIIFDNIIYKRSEVTTGAGIGEDCAVLDFGELECVVSTDPITASIADIGRLSVHISCNDIASNGVQPVAILLTVLLPEGTTEEDIATIMKQAAKAAAACEVQIAGGHTEITRAVNQPVICSTAFGRAIKGGSQSAKTMQEGDLIYVTKKLALEGTGIIAGEHGKELVAGSILTEAETAEAHAMLDSVSVVREGVIAGKIGTHGMHDITEGGVLGAVWEMCSISGCGCLLYEEKMPLSDITKKLATHYGFNPLRMISSGSMLILAEPAGAKAMEEAMRDAGIELTCIGEITKKGDTPKLRRTTGEIEEIAPPSADEIYSVV
jgi:hydrogenase expression/formation protein HypE